MTSLSTFSSAFEIWAGTVICCFAAWEEQCSLAGGCPGDALLAGPGVPQCSVSSLPEKHVSL